MRSPDVWNFMKLYETVIFPFREVGAVGLGICNSLAIKDQRLPHNLKHHRQASLLLLKGCSNNSRSMRESLFQSTIKGLRNCARVWRDDSTCGVSFSTARSHICSTNRSKVKNARPQGHGLGMPLSRNRVLYIIYYSWQTQSDVKEKIKSKVELTSMAQWHSAAKLIKCRPGIV